MFNNDSAKDVPPVKVHASVQIYRMIPVIDISWKDLETQTSISRHNFYIFVVNIVEVGYIFAYTTFIARENFSAVIITLV